MKFIILLQKFLKRGIYLYYVGIENLTGINRNPLHTSCGGEGIFSEEGIEVHQASASLISGSPRRGPGGGSSQMMEVSNNFPKHFDIPNFYLKFCHFFQNL